MPLDTPSSVAYGSADHSFTLQAIMELQKCTGALAAEVKALQASSEKIAGKLDRMDEKLSGVTHKIYAASVVLLIVLAVGGWAVSASWDLAKESVRAHLLQSPAPVPAPAPADPPVDASRPRAPAPRADAG